MSIQKVLLVFAIGIFCSCQAGGEKNKIHGKWMLYKYFISDQDLSERFNPYNERFIQFNEDGTFTSDGRPYGKDTGHWSFNENDKLLLLESSNKGDLDIKWQVSFGEETMELTLLEGAQNRQVVMTVIREGAKR